MLACARSILVTGCCGFVGSWLVRNLLNFAPGAKIVVIDNLCTGRKGFLPDSDRLVLEQFDLRNLDAVRATVEAARPEVVFHLAALHFIPCCNAHPAETLQVNVVGTQNLLDACSAFPPHCLVLCSTAAVYPISDHSNREDDLTRLTDIYGLSKVTNEHQLELFSRSVPTRCAVGRLFNVFLAP